MDANAFRLQFNPYRAAALLGFAGIFVGSLLPWARLWFFTRLGTDGDGVYTLALAAVGALLLLAYPTTLGAVLAGLAGLVSLGITVYDLANIDDLGRHITLFPQVFPLQVDLKPSAAPGLFLTMAGALLSSASCAGWLLANQLRSEKESVPAMPREPEIAGSQQ